MFKGLGQMGDMAKLMKSAKEIQERMAALQEELKSTTLTGEAGAGLVKATATGKGELTALSIDPSIFTPEDKEVAEDLILAAVKDAQAKAAEHAKTEMGKLTEAFGIPAGMKLPF